MKKLFISMCLLVAGIATAQAQSLMVGSKTIDLTKNGTYTGIGTKSGTATYIASSRTLVLKNVSLQDERLYAKDLNSAVYSISLDNDLEITNSKGTCIYFENSRIMIRGNEHAVKLDNSACETSGKPCVQVHDGQVNIFDAYFDAYSNHSNDVLLGTTQAELTFALTFAMINSYGDGSALKGFKSVTFDDCLLQYGEYVSGKGVFDEGKLTKYVLVEPYLRVGNEMVRTVSNTTGGTNWTWDKATKTLTLTNANVWLRDEYTNWGLERICNNVDGLTLQIKGLCTLGNWIRGNDGIYSNGKITIKGEGVAENKGLRIIKGTKYCRHGIWGTNITIDNINIEMDVDYYGGIVGGDLSYTQGTDSPNNKKSDLTIRNSRLKISKVGGDSNRGAIHRFTTCTMEGCQVDTKQSPGVCFRSDLCGFGTTKSLYGNSSDEVLYIDIPTTDYNIEVGGTPVTNLNETDVQTDGLSTGKISYNKSTKELTLDAVSLTPKFAEAISIREPNVKIVQKGNIYINCRAAALGVYEDGVSLTTATTENTPTMFVSGEDGTGMFIAGNNFSIKANKPLYVTGGMYGILSAPETSAGSKVTFSGNSQIWMRGGAAALSGFENNVFNSMDFYYDGTSRTTPGCYLNEYGQACQNGGEVVSNKWVCLAPVTEKYDLYVGGTQVNNANCKGIGSKYITAGGGKAATYDPETKTLTLDGITIDTGEDNVKGIWNHSVDGLTIDVASNSSFKKKLSAPTSILLGANTTIKGTGTLDLIAITSFNSTILTLKDIEVNAESFIGAKSSDDGYNTQLLVDLTSPEKRITADEVRGFGSLTLLNGTQILKPEGAYFDAEKHTVVNTAGNKATGIVFADKTAVPSGIGATPLDNEKMRNREALAEGTGARNGENEIYDLAGRKVSKPAKGLYIQNGKKVIK